MSNHDTTGQRGVTLIEMMVSIFVSLIVVMALGRVMTMNQRAWSGNRDKSNLQSNSTLVLERMSRSIREARTLQVTGADQFQTRDENDAVLHTYRRVLDTGTWRIQEDGVTIAPAECTVFTVAADADTSSLLLDLELTDASSSSVRSVTRVAKRNLGEAI